MSVVNLKVKLAGFSEHWSPKVVARFNGHDVMVVKAEGELVWLSHPDTPAVRGSGRCRIDRWGGIARGPAKAAHRGREHHQPPGCGRHGLAAARLL